MKIELIFSTPKNSILKIHNLLIESHQIMQSKLCQNLLSIDNKIQQNNMYLIIVNIFNCN